MKAGAWQRTATRWRCPTAPRRSSSSTRAPFARRRRIAVTLRGRPLSQINELEWVDGALLANVWHQRALVRIDPASGRVTAVVDLAALVAELPAGDPEAVANGIAWDAKGRRLFVTGKLWPTVFEVKLVPEGLSRRPVRRRSFPLPIRRATCPMPR